MISESKKYAVVDKLQFRTFCTLGCHATRCHSSFKLLVSWYNFYTNLHIYTCLYGEYCWNVYEHSLKTSCGWSMQVQTLETPGLECKLLTMNSNKLTVFRCFEINHICRGCISALKLIPDRWQELHVPLPQELLKTNTKNCFNGQITKVIPNNSNTILK